MGSSNHKKYSPLAHSWLIWLREHPQVEISLMCKMYWKVPSCQARLFAALTLWGQGHNYSLFRFLWSAIARLISVSDDGECSSSMMVWYFSDPQGINLTSLGPHWRQRWDTLYLGRKTHCFLMQPVTGILLLQSRKQEKRCMLLGMGFHCKLQSRTIWADLCTCINFQSPRWALIH